MNEEYDQNGALLRSTYRSQSNPLASSKRKSIHGEFIFDDESLRESSRHKNNLSQSFSDLKNPKLIQSN